MSLNNMKISEKLVPENYLKLALDATKSNQTVLNELLEKRKLPEHGWSETQIEILIHRLAELDSNNFPSRTGLGEREARIICPLVARRHYNFGHGVGRSGDLLEAQPKAAGSTVMASLTNALLLDLIHEMGMRSCSSCFLVPMATGMTLTLCFLTLRKLRPRAEYVIWSRIDQKSCFKSITAAGFVPIIVDPLLNEENSLITDVATIEQRIFKHGIQNIACLFSTTSCFAPRNCDDLDAFASLAKDYDIPHVLNNAYGLQSTFLTHQIEQASHKGRIDLIVQSTDKNLMVPVGGAIVAGFDQKLVSSVAKTYAGRAACSQYVDVLMTLLFLGKSGYMNYVEERKRNFIYLSQKLDIFAKKHNTRVIKTGRNPISLALSLEPLNSLSNMSLTKFGSMLYTRGISGVRVVAVNDTKTIEGYEFKNWSAHNSKYEIPYLTVAAALGITTYEIDAFFFKLEKCWMEFLKDSTRIKT